MYRARGGGRVPLARGDNLGFPLALLCLPPSGPLQGLLTGAGSSPRLRTGQTYWYLFSHPSRMPVYPSWMGADHADDLQYVFGKPFSSPLGYRAQDRTVSKSLIAYWTNFARTG